MGYNLCRERHNPYEYLRLKFIKEILGVHSKTSNDACRTELNSLPLRDNILNLVYSFNSLVSKLVDVNRSHNSWFILMGNLFNTLIFISLLNPKVYFC